MPFKSEAQRRYFHWAKNQGKISSETVAKWEAHTPKGKDLPERVKQAAFLDELEKISKAKEAATWEDAKSWVKEHPLLTGAAAGTLAAGGIVGRRLLQKAAPATGARQAQLRELAKRHGISFPTAGYQDLKGLTKPVWEDVKTPEGREVIKEYAGAALENMKRRLRLGGLKPADVNPVAAAGEIPVSKGVTVNAKQYLAGPGEVHGPRATQKIMEELDAGGKVMELSPEVGLSRFFERGGAIGDLAKKKGLEIPGPGSTLAEKKEYLRSLQSALGEEYGQFVMKPSDLVASSGAFPSHRGDWGKLFEDYEKRLRPKMEKLRSEILANPEKYELSATNVIAQRFREDPAYVGTALEAAMEDPSRTLGQKMMDIVRSGKTPAEYRVHMIGGEVPDELAYSRYSPVREVISRIPGVSSIMSKGQTGSSREAAKWVRENVAPSIAEKYRPGTFGLDVVRVKEPGGGYGFRLVELNPSNPSSASGFLHTQNPMMPHDLYQWIHGKSSPAVTGLKALGAGAGTAIPVAGIASAAGDSEQRR